MNSTINKRSASDFGSIFFLVLILSVLASSAHAQQEVVRPQSPHEVVRINTELVQTGVTVFDKQGRFVDGLKKEDFELRVDGRAVNIEFF